MRWLDFDGVGVGLQKDGLTFAIQTESAGKVPYIAKGMRDNSKDRNFRRR